MMSFTALLTWLLFILGFGGPVPCGETDAVEISDGMCTTAASSESTATAPSPYFSFTDISNGL